jgi:hypothetical protein
LKERAVSANPEEREAAAQRAEGQMILDAVKKGRK